MTVPATKTDGAAAANPKPETVPAPARARGGNDQSGTSWFVGTVPPPPHHMYNAAPPAKAGGTATADGAAARGSGSTARGSGSSSRGPAGAEAAAKDSGDAEAGEMPPCCWNCGTPPAVFAGPAPADAAGPGTRAWSLFPPAVPENWESPAGHRGVAPPMEGARGGPPLTPVWYNYEPRGAGGVRGYSNPDPYGCGWFYGGTGLCGGSRGVAPPMAGARYLPPMRGAPQYVHGGDDAYGPPPSWFYGARGARGNCRCGGC
ncbi:hypothetical protein H9P43_002082 [Blastocladiella emersonii ATCC 22665]|nr:hypothetical protein H9P43_002082 [Blastocladiella emersonii ATCC 22665]